MERDENVVENYEKKKKYKINGEIKQEQQIAK